MSRRMRIVVTLLAGMVLCSSAALALTEEEKELLISPEALAFTPAEGVIVGGDPTRFQAPCAAMPAVRTPHDGMSNDDGWTLVDFCSAGATGSGSAFGPDCHHNDDDSASLALPFVFGLYGDNFGGLFINNNGNLSFGALFSTFTASGFPVSNFPMVAPFWGDVDTGDQFDFSGPADDRLGHVWFKFLDTSTLAVTWDNVGYYNEHDDKLSTFQVLISDGTNPDLGPGNNVCFCYDDMQWTTGDASGGFGGFGGVPATVGTNRGNGVDFFQIGRFDHSGADYDGPFATTDGVDFLDGQGTTTPPICFNTSGLNIPPIPLGFPAGDTVTAECDATLDLDLDFLSPEGGQLTFVSIADPDGAQADGMVITNVPGNTASVNLNWTPDVFDVGTYVLTMTAMDSFAPPGETVKELTVVVECPLDPFGGIVRTGTRRIRLTMNRPTPDTDGFRCVETDDPGNPDFTGIPFTPFDTDPVEVDFLLSAGNGIKTVCCEYIDVSGEISEPICSEIELEITCDPSALSQGYWHRQCLGAGLISPGRNGRGPQEPLEPDFTKDLVPAVNAELEDNIFLFQSCEEGMTADPPSDKCEQAIKQYSALLFNVASDRLQDSCQVDLSAEGCASTLLADLLDEMAALINSSDEDNCLTAQSCAAALNAGAGVVVESGSLAAASDGVESEAPTMVAATVAPGRTSSRQATGAVAQQEVQGADSGPGPATVLVSTADSGADDVQPENRPAEKPSSSDDPMLAIERHLSVLANASATQPARTVSEDALLTALGGGYEPQTRLRIVHALAANVDIGLHSLLARHLEDIRDEARDFENENLAREAERLLAQFETAEE